MRHVMTTLLYSKCNANNITQPNVFPNPSPPRAKGTDLLGLTSFGICQGSCLLTPVSRQAECPEGKETPNLPRSLRWLGAARPAFWLVSLSLAEINLPPAMSCTHGSDLHLRLLPPTSNASTQKERWRGAVESPPEALPAVSAIRTVSEKIHDCLLHHNSHRAINFPLSLLFCWPVMLCCNFTAWKVYSQLFIAAYIHTYLLQSPCCTPEHS